MNEFKVFFGMVESGEEGGDAIEGRGRFMEGAEVVEVEGLLEGERGVFGGIEFRIRGLFFDGLS